MAFPAVCFAETIILKSGEKIEGKILEITDNYIRVEQYGLSIPYLLDEIESIDRKEPIPSLIREKASFGGLKISEVEQKDYFVHQTGVFRFIPPREFILDKHVSNLALFKSKPPIPALMQVSLIHYPERFTDEELFERISKEEALNILIEDIEKHRSLTVLAYNKTIFNGIPAWELTLRQKSILGENSKGKFIIFVKNNIQFTIFYIIKEEFFNEKEKQLKESLATFKLF